MHENLVASTNLLAVQISFFFFFPLWISKMKGYQVTGSVKKKNIEVG